MSRLRILELIRNAGGWNDFNGSRIAADLEENRSLWPAAFFAVGADSLFPDLRPYSNRSRLSLSSGRKVILCMA
jgi:hypothetical protein